MKGGITAVKNTLFNHIAEQGEHMRKIRTERIREVIRNELTEFQQDAIISYYFHRNSISQIAAQRGVNKSTVCRTLHRAEKRLRRSLQY